MSNIKHYDMTNLKSKNANYNIIFGRRNNGKSYQIKKTVLTDYFENHKRFIYLRRSVNEIKKDVCETYFDDFDIMDWSEGKYNAIVVKGNKFFLANITEDFKIKLGDKIGYIWTLVHYQNYKSGSYLDVGNIIFEEFMTNTLYLSNEVTKLDSIYSTVDRNRHVVRMWLVGNAISRICPYIDGWNIRNVFFKLKPGDLVTTESLTADGETTKLIAIERCSNDAGGKSNSFTDMFDSGDYITTKQPLLPGSYKDYKSNYKFVFCYKGFKFLCEYLSKDTDTLFFIRPKYNEIKPKTVVFGDINSTSIYYQKNIYDFRCRNKNLRELFASMRESNIFFSDNRTGTEFRQLIDFSIRL